MNLTTGDQARHDQVSERLSQDLEKFLLSYRTHDRKVLTEGEVMTALGRMVARRCKTAARVNEWCANIAMASLAIYDQMTKGTK